MINSTTKLLAISHGPRTGVHILVDNGPWLHNMANGIISPIVHVVKHALDIKMSMIISN